VTYRYRDRTPKGLPPVRLVPAGAATIRCMSKAFTKESDNEDDDDELRLPPLPAGGKNYITPQGFATLRQELKTLIDVTRPKMVEAVHWAASNGDRSENADYHYS